MLETKYPHPPIFCFVLFSVIFFVSLERRDLLKNYPIAIPPFRACMSLPRRLIIEYCDVQYFFDQLCNFTRKPILQVFYQVPDKKSSDFFRNLETRSHNYACNPTL
jgi:hypothetical protein